MTTTPDALLEDIIAALQRLPTEVSARLVENILAAWGRALVADRSGLPVDVDPPEFALVRLPAQGMWFGLQLPLNRQTDPTPIVKPMLDAPVVTD